MKIPFFQHFERDFAMIVDSTSGALNQICCRQLSVLPIGVVDEIRKNKLSV